MLPEALGLGLVNFIGVNYLLSSALSWTSLTRWVTMRFDLEAARIKSLPDDAFYIADFITEDEEEALLQKVWSIEHPLELRSYAS